MDTATRYEILGTIATGDFATVYRARDRELGREVAVKQIHEQFLHDPRQLERYWREAQLLASLQHPNILTIYDVVRPRGWLILELMRGSLQPVAQGEPIDLDYLRFALICCLNALNFLHTNGIVHGDVKPSNMLTDAVNRVKLGDFGLARRASSEEGSLLKGTTKYIAPELVSNQFGPRGPASDLYSLGFAAYELMCGRHFESLFPALSMFGPDPQIAWLMWHAAPDRHLPKIKDVLEGVPDDLVYAIEHLSAKDQNQRFRTATDALKHLTARARPAVAPPPRPGESEAAPPAAAEVKPDRRRRIAALAAVACSLVVSVAMLIPWGGDRRGADVPAAEPMAGVVRRVDADNRLLVLEPTDGSSFEEITLRPRDEVFINDKRAMLTELAPGDEAKIEFSGASGAARSVRVMVTRPETVAGRIETIEADEGTLTLDVGTEAAALVVQVTPDLEIRLNGQTTLAGNRVALDNLQPDDRATLSYLRRETGLRATRLEVARLVTLEGVLRDLDAQKREITVATGADGGGDLVTLPLAEKVEVALNHRSDLEGQLLKPADLKPGDKVTVAHDLAVTRIDAYRVLGQGGTIAAVHAEAGTLEVTAPGDAGPTSMLVNDKTLITLAGEPAALADLRPGDQVDVTHDSPGAAAPTALSIAASRPADPHRWAVLIGIEDYDDRTLTRLEYPADDAQLLQKTLIDRYRVPPSQAMLLTDASQVRLQQALPGVLDKLQPDDSVVVYYAGHAYRAEDGQVYLAPKSFNLRTIEQSGLALRWLVDEMEKSPAKDKLLLLDSSHAGSGRDLAQQPSAAEMVQSLAPRPGKPPLRTVTAVASTAQGQRGLAWPEKGHGLFAFALAEGYAGKADANQDGHIDGGELGAFLQPAMSAAAAGLGGPQTPQLILPDASPPRLSAEAQAAIRQLLGYLGQARVELFDVKLTYADAERLAPGQPEPGLAYALVLLKARERNEAVPLFQRLSLEHPEMTLPLEALAWIEFDRRTYEAGVRQLVRLAAQAANVPAAAGTFEWMGRLREFAGTVAEPGARPPEAMLTELDRAVAALPAPAGERYQAGRAEITRRMAEFDRRIAGSNSAADASLARVQRQQIAQYADFPFDEARNEIMTRLEE